jgi:flagellar motor protein MotB
MLKHGLLILLSALLASPAVKAQDASEVPVGEAVERHLSPDEPLTQWAHDPQLLQAELGDRLEQRAVPVEQPKTVKLRNVVPPIRFESGVADIPPTYIEKLRETLEGMRHLENVRLHLVGHADDQPLSDRLAGIYGDNAGLSRERAGEVAEFIQAALALPPEAISFEWAGDTQPIATNATPEGRALNRRVEVEVWYDEIESGVGVEEVVVSEEIKRVKVCRMETLCKLRYREGHEWRARVKNLIPPLRFGDDSVGVPEGFVEQVREALHNLRNKQNVTVKLVGFTDDAPLRGRAERIYGTHLALSKARAHRVALALQEALDLPNAAIASEGRGTARPVAPNETARGRALNRRVEVEFWYDDPLQELPDELQLCPDAAAAEVVTKTYHPPWGRIPALQIDAGRVSIPPGFAAGLRRAVSDVDEKTNARLRFIGYTSNERLDRRTALVYGDDIGLSTARARRAMETVKAELGLSDSQVEHEGRGYLHSDDVVNAGFIQGDTSHVVVQVVYDDLAVLDDHEGVDATPITRELSPRNPLGLNLMRITVDGEPLDDPGRSSADIQRCTDVALENADIQFRFDSLKSERRLSVTSQPTSVQLRKSASPEPVASAVRFRMYANYTAFIERSEVRLFDQDQSVQAVPLDVIEIDRDGIAEWRPTPEQVADRFRLKYVLRAYDGEGHFDETAPRSLRVVHDDRLEEDPLDGSPVQPDTVDQGQAETGAEEGELTSAAATQPRRDELLRGYGENDLSVTNIPLGSGTVEVQGSGIPREHTVWLAGEPVPVDEHGNFVAETILPSGMHTVELAVLDQAGNGELFLRDLELEGNDWFYVGMADLTLAANRTSGPADLLRGDNAPDDLDSPADGRLAFYIDGRSNETWRFTASADTREGPVEDLFTNFIDKSPESLFRRIDPDHYYPTYGDDSTVKELTSTTGKLFLKLSNHENHALWGNFGVSYLDNELAHVDRGLYGANVHYQSPSTTSFGERRLALDAFAAEPGTVPSREEFRATGGSLYFLRRQDLLIGSDRARIEVRDRDSGLVTSVVHLSSGLDYDIDYLQGRILLAEPLSSTAGDTGLVRNGALGGDEVWLVVQYEYTPGFEEIDTLATGGQGHYWFGDFLKLGLTANTSEEGDGDSSLYAAQATLRRSAESWLKLQAGVRDGLVSSWSRSDDGGFGFLGTEDLGLTEADAGAYRGDVSIGLSDLFAGAQGRLTLYGQTLDAGYSMPGLTAPTNTRQFGGTLTIPLTERLHLSGKADRKVQAEGLETTAAELDMGYQLTDRWSVNAGLRNELREDSSPVVPVTQQEGERTDAAVQVAYDSKGPWRGYGFAQGTLSKSGNREDNGRVGMGGSYRLSDRLSLDAEASHGDLGPAGKLGTSYQATDRTTLYLNYAIENERADSGLRSREDKLIAGARTRLSDSASVYLENRQQRSDSMAGLTHSAGISLTPTDRWNLGSAWDMGTLIDRETGAETERKVGSLQVGYGFEKFQFSSGIEYRLDETQQLDGTWSERTTYVFRNSLKIQMTPDWRVVGRLNHSFSDSSLGQFYDGGYTEGVAGFAYRPVGHDRLNVLSKYTYFYNLPASDQFAVGDASAQFTQKSHIASFDVMYDLTRQLSVGLKYAYRLGQLSLDRENPEFFDNNAHLYILRADWRFSKDWEGTAEMRVLDLVDLEDRRSGALLGVYRYVGDHLKVGVGYNFTDFSDDLTDLSYDSHGLFINLMITM